MKTMTLIGTLIAMAIGPAFGESSTNVDQTADIEAIKAACLDYVEGYYDADAARIERGVYKDLVKRKPMRTSVTTMDRKILINLASSKREKPEIIVEVLDVYQNVATAKVISEFMDYCQLAKLSGQWQIVNVLWVNKTE